MNQEDQLNDWFKSQNWDSETPREGHENRFLSKLHPKPKSKLRFLFPISIAATLLVCIGIIFTFLNHEKEPEVRFSKEMQTTHNYFTNIIESKKMTLEKSITPENKKIIEDAQVELKKLEEDYKILEQEILKNGENEQLVYAMITNFELRISFLKTIFEKIKENNNIKYIKDEKFI